MHLKNDTLHLADVFENFREICLKTYHLHPEKFLSGLGLSWQTAFKKAEVKLELLFDIGMLLMVDKHISRGICYAVN